MAEPNPVRERLLIGAIDYVTEQGIGDLSLRTLAEALGTSHRMLIYHFGSKEELLRAIVERMEERQRETIAELMSDPEVELPEMAKRMWAQLAEPELRPFEKLFFEVYAQAAQGKEFAVPLLRAVLDETFGPLLELHLRAGLPPARARAQTRLGVAVTRGLLLDLVGSEDRAEVDRAMKLQIELFERDLRENARPRSATTEAAEATGELHARLVDAWNSRDAGTYAGLFQRDGSLVGWDGSMVTGEGIRERLERVFAQETPTEVTKVREIRELGPSAAVLSGIAGMVPQETGELDPSQNAVQTLVAERDRRGRWRAAMLQHIPASYPGRPDLAERHTAELRELVESGAPEDHER
jgi:uncharacterized protein (TIGR02246 family)